MTVIAAAVTKKDGVVMAADARVMSGWEKSILHAPKFWVARNFYAVGTAGCLRTQQVLKHYMDWPKFRPDEDTDLEAFFVRRVVPEVFKAAEGHGVTKDVSGVKTLPVTAVVAFGNDKIATVDGNGCILIPPEKRIAVGSGYAEALGSLGDDGPWEPVDVVEAVRRATVTAYGCGGDITSIDTKTLTFREWHYEPKGKRR